VLFHGKKALHPQNAFTKNRSKRDLRMANKGINSMHAIQMALAGRAIGEGEKLHQMNTA